MLDPPSWLASVFPWSISPAYFEEASQSDPKRCLIDSPDVTMTHPIIDFDVNKTCDFILESAKEPPSYRLKPLLAVVRGMGSGKTRCFEEIRRELLRRPGVLSLGVTFNGGQKIGESELKWGTDYRTAFSFMVIARFSSALFDIDLDDMRKLITRQLPTLNTDAMKDIGRDILSEFFRFVVAKLKSQGIDIDDVVVVIDEVYKAEKDLWDQYCNQKEACSVLREALLEPQTIPYSFHSTLCISSLNMSALGKTLSDRPVKALDIPSTLNTSRIVKEWWRCTKEDEHRMRYVAACINSLPRAVQLVQNYLNRNSQQSKDSYFMKALFEDLKASLAEKYIWDTFPDNNVLFSILYAKEIKLDSKVQQMIARSILLNSIETSLKEEATIIPKSSLTVLAGCKNEQKDYLQLLTAELYKDLLQEIADLAGNGSTEGIPFESFVAKWMRYRWSVASTAGKSVCLGEFLGIRDNLIKNISNENVAIKDLFGTIFTTSGPVASDFTYLTNCSKVDPAGHFREVSGIIVNEKSPVAARRGAIGDDFDLLIILYRGNGLKPLLLYIDHKSPRPDNPELVDKYNSTKDMKQYQGVKEMCEEANVPFIFSYWTHYPGCLQTFDKTDDCFVLREEECKSFFGPMWSIYIACRSTFEN